MNRLIHVLGADIPHHNVTILKFLDELAAEYANPEPWQVMLVSSTEINIELYPQLQLSVYDTKKQLAKAMSIFASQPQLRFFCHGQFNPWVWLALLTRKIKKQQFYWHIWGADLYEESRAWKFRCLYWLRRRVQGRVAEVFATVGDLSYYRQRYPTVPASLLYFPTRLPADLPPLTAKPMTVPTFLLGNSGDPTNCHCQALQQLADKFGQAIKVIVPMGYPQNNQPYIDRVRACAQRLFTAGQVQLLTESLPFTDYLRLLEQCDAGYFIFQRQQGIGTLSLLLVNNIPVILSRNNLFWQDMVAQQLPVLFDSDTLDPACLRLARQQLQRCDKSNIDFLYPRYRQGWVNVMQRLQGEHHDG